VKFIIYALNNCYLMVYKFTELLVLVVGLPHAHILLILKYPADKPLTVKLWTKLCRARCLISGPT
jgi:hypothetical protein